MEKRFKPKVGAILELSDKTKVITVKSKGCKNCCFRSYDNPEVDCIRPSGLNLSCVPYEDTINEDEEFINFKYLNNEV